MDEVRVAVIRTGVLDRLVADDPEFGRDLFRSIGEVLAERLDRRTSGVVAGMAWSWG